MGVIDGTRRWGELDEDDATVPVSGRFVYPVNTRRLKESQAAGRFVLREARSRFSACQSTGLLRAARLSLYRDEREKRFERK